MTGASTHQVHSALPLFLSAISSSLTLVHWLGIKELDMQRGVGPTGSSPSNEGEQGCSVEDFLVDRAGAGLVPAGLVSAGLVSAVLVSAVLVSGATAGADMADPADTGSVGGTSGW
jgi:hypothetical protein